MTNCEAIKELLVARLYDELDEGGAARLESHLGACGDCRDELARLESARTLLQRAELDENAKRYYSDDKFRQAIEQVLTKQAEEADAIYA